MHKLLVAVAAGTLLLLGLPVQAATVFDNYVGGFPSGGVGSELFGDEFVPTSDFNFTGAGAYLARNSFTPSTATLELYSETSGLPGTLLWSSATLNVTTLSLYTATYSGPPILLTGGTPYVLAVDMGGDTFWINGGSSAQNSFLFSGSSWGVPNFGDGASLQFQVFGDPVASTAAPEPISISLLGAGILGMTAARRFRGRGSRTDQATIVRRG